MSDKPEYIQYAFPMVTQFHPQMGIQADPGMELRDWFAGQALAGAMASMDDQEFPFCADRGDGTEEPDDIVARHCYRLADAMLAARKEKQ